VVDLLLVEDNVGIQPLHQTDPVYGVGVEPRIVALPLHFCIHLLDLLGPSRNLLVSDIGPLCFRLRLLRAVHQLHRLVT
jgi:hypothetical protein